MLIFTRKPGQSFFVGGDIKITLLESLSGHSRIGIDAPRDVAVHREEVLDRIKLSEKEDLSNVSLNKKTSKN